ncbi:hypothetical protein [Halorussus ruber]|uniref:hypothetical protein n=1 Tax=Halorussus ruber TaxID=1126238 RepID=UPI001091F559|nr:hypothetical protein [Halorussus ruber]
MKRALLVGLLVLGWVGSAVPASSTTASVSSPSIAPAQENATTDSDATDLPPGVNESGITDPLALVEAHQRTLENVSYTLSTSMTYRRPNGTLVGQGYTVTQVAPGANSYYAVSTQTVENDTRWFVGERYDLAVWANETDSVSARKVPDEETTYHWTSRERAGFEPTSQWELLYAAFGDGGGEVVGQVERDGTTLTKIVSTPSDEETPVRLQYTFTVLVDSQGVVHSMQTLHRTIFEDRPVVVSRTIQVSEMGNTTVERPAWYQRAVENKTTSEGGRT